MTFFVTLALSCPFAYAVGWFWDDHRVWAVRCWLAGAVVIACGAALDGAPLAVGFWGSVATVCAWWLWNNRPRKGRMLSRVAGVVRDLGHRLAVVPAPAGDAR